VPEHPFIPSADGALRLDILDPGMAALAQRLDVAPGLVASGRGHLSEVSQRLWRGLEGRATMKGGYTGPRILPRHDPMAFGLPVLIEPLRVRLLSAERLEELEELSFNVREPRQKSPDPRVDRQMEKTAPQFFLRNIRRLEKETQLHNLPYREEQWRDVSDHGLNVGRGEVLTYAPPDMSYKLTWARLDELRAEHLAITTDLQWETHAGAWTHILGGARMQFPTFEWGKVKGRFATPQELLGEINEGRERPYRQLPRQVIEQYFYRRP